MAVETIFFYSPCTLKLILLLNNIQNIGYLKGHPFKTYTNTEVVYSILLFWIVLIMELAFPSKMNGIGNVQLWVLLSKLTFFLQ